MPRRLEVRREGEDVVLTVRSWDEAVVEAIRALPSRRYGAGSREWRVPLCAAADLAASGLLDDGQVGELWDEIVRQTALSASSRVVAPADLTQAVADSSSRVVAEAEARGWRPGLPPYLHQEAALLWLLAQRRGAVLADDMGIGKTKVAVDVGAVLTLLGEARRVVVVCSATLKGNWAEEIARNAPGARVYVVRGGPASRAAVERAALADPGGRSGPFVIYNYEQTYRSRFPVVARDAVLVCDEAHRVKNPVTRVAETFKDAAATAARVLLLTGTPLTNNPDDLYYLVDIVQPGLLGQSLWSYRKRYVNVAVETVPRRGGGTVTVHKPVGFRKKRLKELRGRVGRAMMRRTKDEVLDLPDKLSQDLRVTMPREQESAYLDMVRELRAEIAGKDGRGLVVTASSAVAKLVRLQQLADGFASDGENWVPVRKDAKTEALDTIVEEAASEGDKVVVWVRFIPCLRSLEQRYREYGAVAVHGAVGHAQRTELVRAFQEDPNVRVFVGQIQTAGEGITLTAASTQVFFSRWWSPHANRQCEDRLHRIGQLRRVRVLNLVAVGGERLAKAGPGGRPLPTIDEVVGRVLRRKTVMSDDVLARRKEEVTEADVKMALGLETEGGEREGTTES